MSSSLDDATSPTSHEGPSDPYNARLKIVLDHRATCHAGVEKGQDNYDKMIITLSGGGIGTSFVYLKDFTGQGTRSPELLWLVYVAWAAWIISLLSVLFSLWSSNKAQLTAISKIDQAIRHLKLSDPDPESAYKSILNLDFEKLAGSYPSFTTALNKISAGAMLVGLGMMLAFVLNNTHM